VLSALISAGSIDGAERADRLLDGLLEGRITGIARYATAALRVFNVGAASAAPRGRHDQNRGAAGRIVGMVVFQRVITWLAQRIIVQQLAQSPAFQRFAVRTTQMVQQQQARVQRAVRLSPTLRLRSAARCPARSIASRLRSRRARAHRLSSRCVNLHAPQAARAPPPAALSEARARRRVGKHRDSRPRCCSDAWVSSSQRCVRSLIETWGHLMTSPSARDESERARPRAFVGR